MRGHLWATLLGYGDTGAAIEMLIGYTLVFGGLYLLARGWQQVHGAQKKDRLVTTELYRYVRHPQYTGIFLALTGQLVHWPTFPTLLLFPVICFVYVRLAKREEEQMLLRYGVAYRNYMDTVPRFFPGLGQRLRMAGGI